VEEKLRKGLTRKQFRRLKLHIEDQLTEDEIAKMENVGQSSVSYSLSKAEERIKKIF
jgi:Putative helix-turn-helix protein, YlxM / p13 like.